MIAVATDPGAALPPAPRLPHAHGRPAFGAYQGHVERVTWDGLAPPHARGRLWRALHAKRWHYASIVGPRVIVAVAVVDTGYAANAFAYLFDRERHSLRAELSVMGLPVLSANVSERPGPGALTAFAVRGTFVRLERRRDVWDVVVRGARGFEVDATLDALAGPPTLCAIAEIPGGVANCTHKSVGLPARGHAIAGGVTYELDGHSGALDHTSGLLARETSWRWASASRADLGLNLVMGFNGPVENAVWHEGRLYPVGAAEIVYDAASPLGAWRVRTEDGAVDLTFRPEGERRQDRDLIVAASRYVQPFGVFSGVIRVGGRQVAVADLPGVTEDHHARW
jgi:hypothetical protein